MDILSATTPLSRKETAKMIATGKTAPLPLDEISDALSMSDTDSSCMAVMISVFRAGSEQEPA